MNVTFKKMMNKNSPRIRSSQLLLKPHWRRRFGREGPLAFSSNRVWGEGTQRVCNWDSSTVCSLMLLSLADVLFQQSWGPPQQRKTHSDAAEDTFIRVTSLRNCSANKCFTEFKWQTHLNINYSEGNCVNQLFMVEFLQRNQRIPIRRKYLIRPRNTSNGH